MRALRNCGALLLPLLLTGCIDGDYKLSDIDKTVGLGRNLTLPSDNTTEGICLDDVLDLGSNNFLKISEDGMYNIDVFDDETFTAHLWVDEFNIPSKSYSGTYTINLGDFRPRPSHRAKQADDDIDFNAPMVDMDYSYNYRTDQIRRMDYVGVKNGKLTVSLTFSNELQQCLSNISQVRFSLPQCIVCGKAFFKGDSIALSSNNVLTLTNIKPSDGLNFELSVLGMDMTSTKSDGSYMSYAQGTGFAFHGALNIGVTVKESAVDFDKVAESKDLTVRGTAVLSRMSATTARGIFTPSRSFGRVGGVSLRNVPSFLNDEEVNLDLYDPQLNINIYSEVPFPCKMSGSIVSKDNKGNVLTRIDVPQFPYKAHGESVASVRRRNSSTSTGDTTVIVIPNICDVIRDVPDSIALIDLMGIGDETQVSEVQLGTDYRNTIRVSVASGIALGSAARIVYNREYTGWNEHFKDFSFVETKVNGKDTIEGSIRVTATVENTIPAYLTLRACGVDMQGNDISSDRLEVKVDKSIAASTDGKTPKETEIVINIIPKDTEVMKAMDGLRFKVLMTGSDPKGNGSVTGVNLNAYHQTVKVTSLKVQKRGKMAYDLN